MSALTQLNFPRFVFRMRLTENPPKIWDAVRRRWLVLTPEEWVRQHLIRLLVERGGVPPGNVSQEYPVALSGTAQRADVVVTGRAGRACWPNARRRTCRSVAKCSLRPCGTTASWRPPMC